MSLLKNTLFRLTLLVLLGHHMMAQERLSLQITTSQENSSKLQKYKYNRNPADSLAAIQTVNSLIQKLHTEGYLLAAIEKVTSFVDQNKMNVALDLGPAFRWLELGKGNLDESLLRKFNFSEKAFRDKKLSIDQIAKLEEDVLSYSENHGYPFASLRFDSLEISDNNFKASLNLDPGPLIRFDSVLLINKGILKSKFLGSYLGVRMGDLYDQRKVESVVSRLRKLQYVRLSGNPQITFQNSEARVSVELERRPVNSIDGIIGFLPNTLDNNRLLITGQFDLDLYNPFATGKHIGLHWRRLNEQTQSINMLYDHPLIFNSDISARAEFDFLKQDTTFTRRDLAIDFSYNLGLSNSISFFTNFGATNLLSTSQFANINRLPEIVDFDLVNYGLRVDLDYLDDAFLPTKGFRLLVSGAVGDKKIRPNADLPIEIYQGVDLSALQYQYDLNLDFYTPLKSRLILYTSVEAGLISNDRLFRNDAYRLGGLNTLRGFNENFFFATEYVKSSVESRFFFDTTSYLSVFADWATLRGDFIDVTEEDNILGVGAGINFSTASGIFNFVYALGTSKATGGINARQSKIHFGYTTRF